MDRLLGPLDELLLSRLITRWREGVWQNALRLLQTSDPQEQVELRQQIEQAALATGGFICRQY